MSIRTVALGVLMVVLTASMWYAIEHKVYDSIYTGRGHMVLTALSVAVFGISWGLDGSRGQRY
jgi:hypothetical protein